ncbi:hypothetical protein ACIQYS_08395 [Psychrobacillus sp. NPDC096426]|uniref:hypothetical protein n=1 Tax=Psychrobacillus sp. NPDC096426 TaxID=3364491 RepID=UPI00380543F2
MAENNKRKRDDYDTGEEVGTDVGAFAGDTMASALDPFGSVAVASAGRALDNNSGDGTVDDDKHDSKTKD